MSILHESLVATAILCLPILLCAACVGSCVAVLQAVTQVQEQSLTLLPKLLVVGAVLVVAAPAAVALLEHLFSDIILAIPAIVDGRIA